MGKYVDQYNKQQITDSFNQAAHTYDLAAALQYEIGDRMLERLDFIKIAPKVILDIGCGTGYLTRKLKKRYVDAEVVGVDIADQMIVRAQEQAIAGEPITYLCCDAETLPLADNSVDMVFSNCYMQWCEKLGYLFLELRRVLKPGGIFMFTTFGPDSLLELRESWAQVDSDVHVHSFIDMHDIGDALVATKFADPVMDMEMIQTVYSEAKMVLRDLKGLGAHNLSVSRHKGLTGRKKFTDFIDAYEEFRHQDGKLPLTYEVVYGHAWAPEPEATQTLDESGEVKISIHNIGMK